MMQKQLHFIETQMEVILKIMVHEFLVNANQTIRQRNLALLDPLLKLVTPIKVMNSKRARNIAQIKQ